MVARADLHLLLLKNHNDVRASKECHLQAGVNS
jgi:hypothetical protein